MAYTVSDVGNMLGVNDETVRRWIREGKIQAKRNMGRGGNSIRLEDVVAFANQPPKSFLGNLVAWLDEHEISYEKVMEASESTGSQIKEKTIAAAMLPLAIVNPVVGAATMVAAKGRRKKANPSYKVRLMSASEECDTVDNTEETNLEEKNEEDTTVQQDMISENGSAPSPSEDACNIEAMIREEQMKLIRLRQELAQIQAQIAVAEGQIEYYNLLLNK